jgi:hypothetical protein
VHICWGGVRVRAKGRKGEREAMLNDMVKKRGKRAQRLEKKREIEEEGEFEELRRLVRGRSSVTVPEDMGMTGLRDCPLPGSIPSPLSSEPLPGRDLLDGIIHNSVDEGVNAFNFVAGAIRSGVCVDCHSTEFVTTTDSDYVCKECGICATTRSMAVKETREKLPDYMKEEQKNRREKNLEWIPPRLRKA